MRKILLLNCLLFLPFLIFSQELTKKADSVKAGGLYLDVSGGLSLPLGSYANADVKNPGSGFAIRGSWHSLTSIGSAKTIMVWRFNIPFKGTR